MEMNKGKMTTFSKVKIEQVRQKVESTKHLFQAVYFVCRVHFVAEKVR